MAKKGIRVYVVIDDNGTEYKTEVMRHSTLDDLAAHLNVWGQDISIALLDAVETTFKEIA
jgi:hypothetical protein